MHTPFLQYSSQREALVFSSAEYSPFAPSFAASVASEKRVTPMMHSKPTEEESNRVVQKIHHTSNFYLCAKNTQPIKRHVDPGPEPQ